MTINVANLFTATTAAEILARGLEVAEFLGLPVTSWRNGDPTKSLYHFLADTGEAQEQRSVERAKAGFLSTAEGDWATVHAYEVYGVTRAAATYATPTVTLRNPTGGVFVLGTGDLTVQCEVTGKTFRSTNNPGTLGPNTTLTYELIAEEAGAASSVAENEITAFVSPATLGTFGVQILSSTAAAAQDEQSLTELKEQCGDTLGALSPNGPPDAYEYVCKNSELTGVTEINRATASGDDATGLVTVYVASSSGVVSGASVAAAQTAVEKWSTPLCIRPTVVSAAGVAVDVSAQIRGVDIPASYVDAIRGALTVLVQSLPIGGVVYRSRIISEIHKAVPQVESVGLVLPVADVVLAAGDVPTLGTLNAVEV